MNNLFAYGTLLCEEIMTRVTGVSARPQPAFAKGYSRYAINGENFPAIVADSDGLVSGVVYRHLSDETMAAIDNYEGDWYQRRTIQVTLTNRTLLTAFTYVLAPDYHEKLAQCDWSYEAFCRDHRIEYLRTL